MEVERSSDGLERVDSLIDVGRGFQNMYEEINVDRRRFLSTAAALTIAGARFDAIGAERARPVSTKSFGELHQIDAGVLSVGYAEVGRNGGPAVLLLHGWPYDIHSFVEV